MTMTESKGLSAAINVTPMIDVLLVLLIIFMVIVPAVPRGESAQVPQPDNRHEQSKTDPVVLELLKNSAGQLVFRINQQSIAQEDLKARLASIYANRSDRSLFLKGDDALSFTQVAEVIDLGHAAGADRIGLMTPKLLAGQ